MDEFTDLDICKLWFLKFIYNVVGKIDHYAARIAGFITMQDLSLAS